VRLDVVSLGELLVDLISTDGSTTFKPTAGGAPANVAVACSRLGLRTGFIGKVGDDVFGRSLRDALKRERVDVSRVYFDKGDMTTLAIVSVDASGERSFQFYRGADARLKPDEVNEDYVAGSRVFHFGSISLISEPSRSATLKAVRAAKRSGLTITYDPNLRLSLWRSEDVARRWMMAGLRKADVVKVSDEEAKFMFGPDIEEGAERMLKLVDRVFISLGERGCYYADGDSRGYSKPYRVKVRDTTGAGDGFMGGVIYGTLSGWGVEKTASFSNAVGALVVSRPGAMPAMPTLEEVVHLAGSRLPDVRTVCV